MTLLKILSIHPPTYARYNFFLPLIAQTSFPFPCENCTQLLNLDSKGLQLVSSKHLVSTVGSLSTEILYHKIRR